MPFPLVVDNPFLARLFVTESAITPVSTGAALPPGGAAAGADFVFDPTQPAAVGPIVFGTFGGAVDASNALASGGAKPVCTIFCKLGGLTVIPAVRLYDLTNVRLVGDQGQQTGISELRFANGSTFKPPLSLERMAISSASASPLFVPGANVVATIDTFLAIWGRAADVPMFEVNLASAGVVFLSRETAFARVASVTLGAVGFLLEDGSTFEATAVIDAPGAGGTLDVVSDSTSVVMHQAGFTGTLAYVLSPQNFGSQSDSIGPVAPAAYADSGLAPLSLETGTTATLAISAQCNAPGGVANANIAVDISGATTVAAADATGTNTTVQAASNASLSVVRQFTGLTPGTNVFKLFLKTIANSVTFSNVNIVYLGP